MLVYREFPIRILENVNITVNYFTQVYLKGRGLVFVIYSYTITIPDQTWKGLDFCCKQMKSDLVGGNIKHNTHEDRSGFAFFHELLIPTQGYTTHFV